MNRLALPALSASLLAPGAAALAEPHFNPGITLVGTGGEGPMSGFSAGIEATLNAVDSDRFFDTVHYGALLQFELDFGGDYRVNLGGQLFGAFAGAELAWSTTFGASPTQHALMAAPFVGVGVINVAWRNYFSAEGIDMAAAMSVKFPLMVEDIAGQIIPSGRPLRDAAGAVRRPQVVVLGPRPLPAAVAELPTDSRRALGRAWLEDARDEHAAVDAFEKLARQLAAHRAPRALIRRARCSARDERRHACDCLNLAEALLGLRLALVSEPSTDGPLPDLPTLAAESRLDGAIAEGAAARIAARGAHRATVGPAARLQRTIAREEARHAALGEAIVRWASDAGGRPVRAAVAEVRPADPDAVDVGATAPHGDRALWHRWGRADATERRDAWAAAGYQRRFA